MTTQNRVRSRIAAFAPAALLLIASAHPASAMLTSGPDIISAPASVVNSSLAGGATNDHQQAFNERQRVLLTEPLAVDGGSIPAGTVVSSHMIFLNVPNDAPGKSSLNQVWTFDSRIVGVISDKDGQRLAQSDFLGAPGTTYPGAFTSRGLESNDGSGVLREGYKVSGNSITVGMTVTQPGDWIRVITVGAYSFGGFLPPIDNPQAVNVGKAGRTYPVKFQLTNHMGGFVSDLSVVTSIASEPTSCLDFTGDPSAPLEAEATGSTSLRYDSLTNQYVYNWTTPSTPGCYALSLTLDTGQKFDAHFDLS